MDAAAAALNDPMAAALAAQAEEENYMPDDDDNAQPSEDAEILGEHHEDPFSLAMDDLEGRVVAAIDEVKMHPGVRTAGDDGATTTTVHEELAVLLRPVLEVAAHTGPSVARTYYASEQQGGIEASMESAYERTLSDLVLPVLLEVAQSDTVPAKRGASLEFFKTLWKEVHKAGSWLDDTAVGLNAGPYGPGGSSGSSSGSSHHHHHHHHNQQQQREPQLAPAARAVWRRRQQKRLQREGEILRYWVEAAVACLVAGVFTAEHAASAVYGRAIIAASAALRPSLRHISRRIKDADDRGAARLFAPVMKMVEGVLKKLFVVGTGAGANESVQAACLKFLEIVVLCCSRRPPEESSRRRGHSVRYCFCFFFHCWNACCIIFGRCRHLLSHYNYE